MSAKRQSHKNSQFNVDTQFRVLGQGLEGLLAKGWTHWSISFLVWGLSTLSPLQVLAEKIIASSYETKRRTSCYAHEKQHYCGTSHGLWLPHCKKPSDEDPCGLLLCWECSTSLLLAVQLPQAASAKITVVIGWDYVDCRGRRSADKERLKSSECDGNSSYTLLHRVPPLSP